MTSGLRERTPLLAATLLLAAQGAALAGTLYDPSNSTLPAVQGWSYGVAGPASQSLTAGALTLDSSAANAIQAGYARTDQWLDSSIGTQLSFAARLQSESHASSDRAGFSVIMLDSHHQGIELGFWNDQIWAQSGTAFTHAESASFATGVLSDYALRLQGGSYTLSANGNQILSGHSRDYSIFGAPYSSANFIFLGDDTSSAKARVSLGSISVTAVPEPSTLAMLLGGITLLLGWRRRQALR